MQQQYTEIGKCIKWLLTRGLKTIENYKIMSPNSSHSRLQEWSFIIGVWVGNFVDLCLVIKGGYKRWLQMGFKCNLIVFGLQIMVPSRVRGNFSYLIVPPTSTIIIKFGCLKHIGSCSKSLQGSYAKRSSWKQMKWPQYCEVKRNV